MDGTIIQQGRFTSDGTSKVLSIRSDVDWMHVVNYTVAGASQTTAIGVEYYWQRGMAAGTGIEYLKSNAANAANLTQALSSGGFTLIDPNASIEAAVTGTTITKADPPVCTAANHGYSNGDNVLLSNLTNMPQIGGVLFTIGSVTTNTFELTYFDTNTANFTAETAFQVRRLPDFAWNNGWNNIVAVTKGSTTQVTLGSNEEDISYVVGDIIKFTIPSAFGMTELDGLSGEVLSINTTTNTYTVDIDSSAFTAFAWPASTAVPTNFPHTILVGTESTSVIGATDNTASLKIKLGAGTNGPAGSTSDVIYWRAGKSFSVSNS